MTGISFTFEDSNRDSAGLETCLLFSNLHHHNFLLITADLQDTHFIAHLLLLSNGVSILHNVLVQRQTAVPFLYIYL
jgi:hypothetical protein